MVRKIAQNFHETEQTNHCLTLHFCKLSGCSQQLPCNITFHFVCNIKHDLQGRPSIKFHNLTKKDLSLFFALASNQLLHQ